jgi:hypothetical protein
MRRPTSKWPPPHTQKRSGGVELGRFVALFTGSLQCFPRPNDRTLGPLQPFHHVADSATGALNRRFNIQLSNTLPVPGVLNPPQPTDTITHECILTGPLPIQLPCGRPDRSYSLSQFPSTRAPLLPDLCSPPCPDHARRRHMAALNRRFYRHCVRTRPRFQPMCGDLSVWWMSSPCGWERLALSPLSRAPISPFP